MSEKEQSDHYWMIDECPSACGHYTIRLRCDDGTIDTESNPVATVYQYETAADIVTRHNDNVDKLNTFLAKIR